MTPRNRPNDQIIIHAGHQHERDYWSFALRQTSITEKQLQRYEDCGKRAWVYHSAVRQTYKVKHETCGLRVCPLCCQRHQQRNRERMALMFQNIPTTRLKFITLTLRSTTAPLTHQLHRLTACFRRLRQRKIWGAVSWGVAVIELTRNSKSKQWHPHLHILAEASYIPQATLSEIWLNITGDSLIVDIRKVHDRDSALNELAKYASKPIAQRHINDSVSAGAELFEAMKNRRMMIPFGHWPSPPKPNPPADDLEDDWVPVMPLRDCLERADGGDHEAQRILRQCNVAHNTLARWLKAIRGP